MITHLSRSPADTEALGESWGRTLAPRFIIAISGELGAGKTQLVKGIARGLGIDARVVSPTFALVNVYPGGRLPLFHLDLYRLSGPDQIVAAGLEEFLHANGITAIEWAERWFADITVPPGPMRRVKMESVNETDRRILYEDFGA